MLAPSRYAEYQREDMVRGERSMPAEAAPGTVCGSAATYLTADQRLVATSSHSVGQPQGCFSTRIVCGLRRMRRRLARMLAGHVSLSVSVSVLGSGISAFHMSVLCGLAYRARDEKLS